MNFLVTGGAGFIGRYVVKFLLSRNYNVTIFDNFSNSNKAHISALLNNGVNLIEGDITDIHSFNNLNNFDFVIHLAAQINVDASIADPDYTMKVNVTGTENLLKYCIKKEIDNIIVISSAAIFGEPSTLPLKEDSPVKAISPYGESKALMEQIVKQYSEKFNLNCIILRFFNVYGIGQSDEYAGVISKFLKNIDNDENLIIFGDGTQTRDFIAVEDIVLTIENAIKHIHGKKGVSFNIGSGKNVSINELADLMISISGKKLEIIHKPSKTGDIHHSVTSVDLAKNELNFFPKLSLKEGIKKLLKIS